MPNSPIAGLPYPATTDAPAGPTQIQALTTALDLVVIAKFATTSARDAAVTSPANGQVVQCLDSGLWEYLTGTGWVTTGLRIATTKTSTALVTTTGAAAGAAGIDNSTFTSSRRRMYRLAINGTVQADASTQWRLNVTVDGTSRIDARRWSSQTGGPGASYDTWMSLPFVLSAGTHTFGCTLSITSGSGTGNLTVGAILVATDEGPA